MATSHRNANDTTQIWCEPCKRSDEFEAASYWCRECAEYLCKMCGFYLHKRVREFTGHDIIRVDTDIRDRSSDAGINDSCVEHKDESLKMFCLDHNLLCCVICISTKHRRCENVCTFDELVEKMTESGNIKKLSDKLEDIISKTETVIISKQQKIDNLDKKTEDMKTHTSALVQIAKDKLDKLNKQFQNSLKLQHLGERMKITKQKEILETFQISIRDYLEMIQTVTSKGSSKQVILTNEKVKAQLSKYVELLKATFRDDQDVEIGLRINGHLNSMATQMASIAELTTDITPCTRSINPVVAAATSFYSTSLLKKPSHVRFADPTGLSVIKIGEIKSEDSWFTGGVFLQDGHILFSDHSNELLKIYKVDGTFVFEHKLDYRPYDVAYRAPDEIFVSFGTKFSIKRYRVKHNSLTFIGTVHTKAYGIDVKDNTFVAATGESINVVELGNTQIKPIFREASNPFVAISKTDTKIYCNKSNEVLCYSEDGTVLFRYSNPDLRGPRGLAIDPEERIFVSGLYSCNLFMINKSGSEGKILLENMGEVTKPYAIGCDAEGQRLFVTSWDQSPAATIYKLTS